MQAGVNPSGTLAARRLRLDLSSRLTWKVAEPIVLVLFVAASFSAFALHAVDAAVHDRVFIGADGRWSFDQLQYLSWATDAGYHVLAANLFSFGSLNRVFLHPVWLISGLLHVQVGLSYSLLLAAWKAVAIVAIVIAVRAYARSLVGSDPRKLVAVLVLSLFMVSPLFLVLNGHLSGIRDMPVLNNEVFAVYWMMGYFPIALAVAAEIAFVLQAGALLSGGAGMTVAERRRRVLLASVAGLTAAWLHPWQGLTLIVIVVGLVVWERPSLRRHLVLLVPLLATAAPVLYYDVLARIDPSWGRSETATAGFGVATPALLTLLPIVLLMLPGYLGRAGTPAERMVRLWPLAIGVVYVLSPSDQFHALGGCSIPASILIVRGWPEVRKRLSGWRERRATRVAICGLCIAVIAAPVAIVTQLAAFRNPPQRDAEISRDEARALDRIAASKGAGGVLTNPGLGAWVPAVSDRATWVGHDVWTPDYTSRARIVSELLSGRDDAEPAAERQFVLATGAAFVLEPCGSGARLDRALLPAGFTVWRAGCVTLYSRIGRS